ncbi:MAG: SIR2 family protein [Chloroflexota bacterium]|nr:SIR2 family protein [Chloroflexota bacterium]
MNLPHHRLFVLGAGFSKPAGFPLAMELLEDVRESIRWIYREGNKFEQEIQEWIDLYPGTCIDLERVLAYSHRKHYLQLSGSDEYFDHDSVSIVIALREVQQKLIDSTPSAAPALYRQFARRLCPHDVVLTFNYDTLLEQALDEIGKQYTLTPEYWLEGGDSHESRKYVDLLKLHGSIDWYDRYYLDSAMRSYAEKGLDVPNRDPIFGPNPTVPTEPLSRGQTGELGRHLLSRVFRVPNHAAYFPIEGGLGSRVVPFILPPAYDKLLGYNAIVDLWRGLHRTLDAFSSIVMIGYSMPAHDSYAYEALGRVFVDYQRGGDKTYWQQRRVPIQIVTADCSDQSAIKRIPFLDGDKTRVWHRGFSIESLDWIDWGDGK